MKRFILLIVGLVAINAAIFADDEKHIPYSEVPSEAKQFIENNFSGKEILYSRKESELFDKTYKILFSDGTRIEFDRNGKWSEMTSRDGLP